MFSNKLSEKVKKEERLYAPILEALKSIFDRFYVAKPVNYPLQSVPELRNPHLEIIAHGEFFELLQNLINKSS